MVIADIDVLIGFLESRSPTERVAWSSTGAAAHDSHLAFRAVCGRQDWLTAEADHRQFGEHVGRGGGIATCLDDVRASAYDPTMRATKLSGR
jgi:hypothetical protein